MLISPRLSSKLPSICAAGPVRMLSIVVAENSRIDLFAMASNTEDRFRRSSWLDEASCCSVDDLFLSLALVFLNNASGLSTKFLEDVFYSYIPLHKIKIENIRVKLYENDDSKIYIHSWLVINLPYQRCQKCLLGILNIITKSRQFPNSSNGAKNAKPIPHTT